MMNRLQFPDSDRYLEVGNRVKLGRFETEYWLVEFGWFSFDGNRPMCGWYLVSCDDKERIKPLHLTDLDDIYLIEK